MNNLATLEQKTVNFDGAELMAVRADDGKIYVGVKWVCEGIGLSQDRIKYERKKIQDDLVISKGGQNFTLPTIGGNQEVLCLELDFLPLWLAKISITPTMKKESPYLVEKLIKYQLKAKDVLAKAFLNKGSNEFQVLVPKTLQEALRMAANLLDKNQELEIMNAVMEPKVKKYDSFMECGNTQTIGEVAKILGIGPNRLFAFLREKKVLMNGQKGSKNIPYQRYINEGLFAVKESLIMNGKYIFNQPQTLVLPKGVSFIAGLLEQNKISATA